MNKPIRGRPDNWTDQEKKILAKKFSNNTNTVLTTLLPNKTKHAIRNRAAKMNLKKKKSWSEQDKEFLLSNIGNKSYQQIADELKKSRSAVISKYRCLLRAQMNESRSS